MKLEDAQGLISSTHFKSWSTLCVFLKLDARGRGYTEEGREVLSRWASEREDLRHFSGVTVPPWAKETTGFLSDQAGNSPFSIIPGRRPFHLGSRPPWRKHFLPGRAGNPA